MNGFLSKPINGFELNKALLDWLPPEKVSLSAEIVARPSNNDAANGFESVLDSGAGAVNFQNDEELYLKALSYFMRNHAADSAALSAALEAGDAQRAYRVAHTVKSSAATIGAERLRGAALTIETKLANAGGCDAQDLYRFETELSLVLNELERILPPQGAPPQAAEGDAKNVIDAEKTLARLKELESLLNAGSADSLVLLEEIKDSVAAAGAAGTKLISRMEDLDFSGALKALPALMDAAAPCV
ncbi:hypothetical protein FACS1894216_11440 [Synergistales bacterium]|nr:hypothetical protein FACS1894216_11440 [Synergistales bacterium]